MSAPDTTKQEPKYPITPTEPQMAIYELQQVTFGNTKLGQAGLVSRMRNAEDAIEAFKDLKLQAKAFAVGLGINVLISAIALLKLFGLI
jgi:hypothetical protein